jgi:hypothetical protein
MPSIPLSQTAFVMASILVSMGLFGFGNRYWRLKQKPAPLALFIGIRSLFGALVMSIVWKIWSGEWPSMGLESVHLKVFAMGILGFTGLWAFVHALNADRTASALVGQSLQVVVGLVVGSWMAGGWPSLPQIGAALLLLSVQLVLLFREGGIRGWIPALAGVAYGLYYPLSVPLLEKVGPVSFFVAAEMAQGLLALVVGTGRREWTLFHRSLWSPALKQSVFSMGGQLAYFAALGAASLPHVVLLSGLSFSVHFLFLNRPQSRKDYLFLVYFLAAGLVGAWLTLMG